MVCSVWTTCGCRMAVGGMSYKCTVTLMVWEQVASSLGELSLLVKGGVLRFVHRSEKKGGSAPISKRGGLPQYLVVHPF